MKKFPVSKVTKEDLPEILQLAREASELQVFPTLSKAGQKTLLASLEKDTLEIINPELYQAYKIRSGARLLGYAALRNHRYLAQLFVDSEYQRQGVGTALLDKMVTLVTEPALKLRASINAVEFYKNYGFVAAGEEAEVNAIRFLPMTYHISKTHSHPK